jgi:hypothetical protein
MKLLVATSTGHSPRTDPDNDGPLPGELLFPAEQCDKAHCFCRREFVSATTYERTTHARVVELDITPEQVRAIAVDYVVAIFDDADTDEVDAYVHDLTEPAQDFAVGTVVERWGYELRDITDNNLDDDDAQQDG